MPVTVQHKILFKRLSADRWGGIASRDFDDPNAREDFQALRVEAIIEARRSGAERPEFAEGVLTATHPDGVNAAIPAAMTYEGCGPTGPISPPAAQKAAAAK